MQHFCSEPAKWSIRKATPWGNTSLVGCVLTAPVTRACNVPVKWAEAVSWGSQQSHTEQQPEQSSLCLSLLRGRQRSSRIPVGCVGGGCTDASVCSSFVSLLAEDLERGWASEEADCPGPHDGAGDRGDPPEVPVQAAAHPRRHRGQEAAAAELLSHGHNLLPSQQSAPCFCDYWTDWFLLKYASKIEGNTSARLFFHSTFVNSGSWLYVLMLDIFKTSFQKSSVTVFRRIVFKPEEPDRNRITKVGSLSFQLNFQESILV